MALESADRLEEPKPVERVTELIGDGGDGTRVLVLAPAHIEDQLGSFPAAEVILVHSEDAVAERAARELRARLRTGFHQVLTGPAAR